MLTPEKEQELFNRVIALYPNIEKESLTSEFIRQSILAAINVLKEYEKMNTPDT